MVLYEYYRSTYRLVGAFFWKKREAHAIMKNVAVMGRKLMRGFGRLRQNKCYYSLEQRRS